MSGMVATARREHLARLFDAHESADAREAGFVRRMRALLATPADPFSRARFDPGHVTASAFVVTPARDAVLLVLHAKLGRWLQPGGHVEPGDSDVAAAARREVREEVGLADVDAPQGTAHAFDVDVHRIPAHGHEPAHEHFDVRFLFVARAGAVLLIDEVRAARWVPLDEVSRMESDASVLRAVEKLRRAGGPVLSGREVA